MRKGNGRGIFIRTPVHIVCILLLSANDYIVMICAKKQTRIGSGLFTIAPLNWIRHAQVVYHRPLTLLRMAYSMNDVCENKTHSLGIVTATTTSSQTITRLRVLLIIIIHNKHTRSPSHVSPLYWVKVTRRRILFHCQGIECPLKN